MGRFHVHKQHKSGSRWWLWLLVIPVFAFLAIVALAGWYGSNLQPLSDSQEEIIVTIPIGTSTPDIGITLENRGVIRSAIAFEWYTKLNNYQNDLQAGGYKFSPSQSVEEIVAHLREGDTAKDLVTILPAQRIDQIKAAFMESGYSMEEVESALEPAQYAGHPALVDLPVGATLEGYLYPESFQRSTDTKLVEIVEASLDEMASVLSEELVQKLNNQGLSIHEAVTLASIIENEVPAASDDRNTVAQVYLKRINEGILLQADPTARYGTILATGSDEGWRNYDSPYNTYLYAGLPPGPISNVSESSLIAAANPTDTSYLFFVADDNDETTTHFSNTFAEHEAAIEKYCQIKCRSY
jgi:UPF0755 protein